MQSSLATNHFKHHCAFQLADQALPIFSMLMPSSWQRTRAHVCRPILSGIPLMPLVTPVHILGEPSHGEFRRVYIRTERVESIGKTVAEFESEAHFNLCRRPATWTSLIDGAIVVSNDDYLSAERILDPAFMLEGASLLGCRDRSLLAAVPRRGYLFATSTSRCRHDSAHAFAFKQIVEQFHAEAGEHRITPMIFQLLEGRIHTIMEIE
jgi:hypothetical protein